MSQIHPTHMNQTQSNQTRMHQLGGVLHHYYQVCSILGLLSEARTIGNRLGLNPPDGETTLVQIDIRGRTYTGRPAVNGVFLGLDNEVIDLLNQNPAGLLARRGTAETFIERDALVSILSDGVIRVEAHFVQEALEQTARESMREIHVYDEYRPRLRGAAALAAQNDPNKPSRACCNNEQRGMNGGCGNCGAPCL